MNDDDWEDIVGGEWLDWYRLTPLERWRISQEVLWPTFLALGGSLDPEPDSQSPFYTEAEYAELFPPKPLPNGWRRINRSGV